ncbi:hypothetical protein [Streptococcus parauberis]|uniref:hypothetical protein n=1 Tax=Streptococcus parauberis TaxID=1348 RepID=UPI000CCE8FD9|nr:hypothetical protein [Streptococcus parauberis]PNY18697.1 hypothetical protein ASN86_01651 [Streptococcus parauberis]
MLSKEDKQKVKEIIEANKWYTYEEAESELRKHWNPDNDKDGDYITMKRSQIQKILRSDIIGTYLEIHKRKKDQSEDDWFMKTIYGWSQKEHFYLDYSDGTEKKYYEELHVFPKYDKLFLDSDLEQSIILSAFDELLNDVDKVEMREIYEELNGSFGKGKTPFLMTEPYLFALKHEIERRQYPTKILYLDPHSPKEILSRLSEKSTQESLQTEMFSVIDEVIQNVNDNVFIHQSARDVEKQRFQEISSFFKKWKFIYPSQIMALESVLINEGLLEKFNNIFQMFTQPFEYVIDGNIIKNKLTKKYLSENAESLSRDELVQKLKKSIYSFEKYELTKFENALSKDTEFISNSAMFRHQISSRLHQILRNLEVDSILFDSLNHAGIHE